VLVLLRCLHRKDLSCRWTSLHWKGLYCSWRCLHLLNCTWMCLDNSRQCCPWTYLHNRWLCCTRTFLHTVPELHLDLPALQSPVLHLDGFPPQALSVTWSCVDNSSLHVLLGCAIIATFLFASK
jgi:hypothetical protein